MRFTQCRATFVRSQALMGFVACLAACGQERATGLLAPASGEAADTLAVVRAVASLIVEMNARADSGRVHPDFPANCRQLGTPCWQVEISGWQVSPGDRVIATLANLLQVPTATRSPALEPPPCPWDHVAGAGYRTAAEVRFKTRDLAHVLLSRRCYSNRGGRTRGFLSEETFEVRRTGAAWTAKVYALGVT